MRLAKEMQEGVAVRTTLSLENPDPMSALGVASIAVKRTQDQERIGTDELLLNEYRMGVQDSCDSTALQTARPYLGNQIPRWPLAMVRWCTRLSIAVVIRGNWRMSIARALLLTMSTSASVVVTTSAI